jgi:glycosyltransferase involved in cell wall biosynthesis
VVGFVFYNYQEIGLAKALQKKCLEPHILLAGYKKQDSDEFGIPIHWLSCLPLKPQLSLFWGLGDLLNQLKPDIVQTGSDNALMVWQIVKACKRRNIPVVTVQGQYELNHSFAKRILERFLDAKFLRSALCQADYIAAKTPSAQRFLANYTTRKISVAPIGLDTTPFSLEKKTDWKANLGWQNKKVLLYVGMLEERRNIRFLVDLLQSLPNDFCMLFVGSGVKENEYKSYVNSSNLNDRIYFAGKVPQNDLSDVYLSVDAFLLASSYEIYGMVLMEAMWHGLPVFTSRTAGSETIVRDGETGYILNLFDVSLWNKKITEHFSSPKNQTIGKNAHVFIAQNLVWEKAVEKWLPLYEDMSKYACKEEGVA